MLKIYHKYLKLPIILLILGLCVNSWAGRLNSAGSGSGSGGGSTTPGGAVLDVQFHDTADAFGGNHGFVYVKADHVVMINQNAVDDGTTAKLQSTGVQSCDGTATVCSAITSGSTACSAQLNCSWVSGTCASFDGMSICNAEPGCSWTNPGSACAVQNGDQTNCELIPGQGTSTNCAYTTCSSLNGNQSGCQAKNGCTYVTNNCSTFNGNQSTCQSTTGCTWNSSNCSDFNTDVVNCPGTSGCSQNLTNCAVWNTYSTCSANVSLGCTVNYSGDCTGYIDQTSCEAAACSWDGGMSSCSGSAFTSCSGNYQSSCSGSYNTSCSGTYYTGACNGTSCDCSGPNCTGNTPYYCFGTHTNHCIGSATACSTYTGNPAACELHAGCTSINAPAISSNGAFVLNGDELTSISGNTAKIGTVIGSPTSGRVLEADDYGNIQGTSVPTGNIIQTTSYARADANTLGISTYNANDFNDNTLGTITIDYNNGQAASTSVNGFFNTGIQNFAGTKGFTGNIGVGNTSPRSRLEVSGTICVINGGGNAGRIGIGNTNPTAKLDITATGSSSAALSLKVANTALSVTNAGKVGIGNTSPTQILDVTGSVKASINISTLDQSYSSIWDGQNNVPTKNAIYDKIELISTSNASTYTPTATNVTNITSSTPNLNSWSRVGNIITVFGTITVTNTLAVASEVDISLPVASNLGAVADLNGTATMDSTASVNIYIKGDATNDRASIFFTSAGIGQTSTIYYGFQYKVI